jgi:hypothetical protein
MTLQRGKRGRDAIGHLPKHLKALSMVKRWPVLSASFGMLSNSNGKLTPQAREARNLAYVIDELKPVRDGRLHRRKNAKFADTKRLPRMGMN